VRLIQINVVGSVSDRDEIIDIETVARVFVVARRMIDLTDALESGINVTEPPISHHKKIKKRSNSTNLHIPFLTVKGFN
jgi:hypothetical protein